MPNSLPELEAERSKILRQFTTLRDLSTGSICAVHRRCGKPTCHCAKPNDPGHDPQIRLTRKVEGKTVAESFPSPAAWRKAHSEIDEYHRFQKLSTELITVNEKICRHRPIESESSTGNGSRPAYADGSSVRDPAPGGFESSGGFIDRQKDLSLRLRQQDRTPLSQNKKGKRRVVRWLDGSNFYPLRKVHRPFAPPAWSAIVDQFV